MNTLDTNILVRFFVKKSEYEPHELRQREIAKQLILQPSFIPITIILELVWVLSAVYHLSKAEIVTSLQFLLNLPHFTIENADSIAQACEYYLQGMDFADALHLLKSAQSDNFYTFDQKFVKKSQALNTPVQAVVPSNQR